MEHIDELIISELLKEGFYEPDIKLTLEKNKGNFLKTIFDLRHNFFSNFTSNFFTLWRLSNGLTIKEFAKLLNVNYATVRKWETGERNHKSSYAQLLNKSGYENVKINVSDTFFEKSIKQIQKWSK